ncbi:sensor histidine kinase [uncultured Nostoc sp.]
MSALADIEAIATQKNLILIRELPVPGGIVAVDAVIFRRVLDNLLSNAIKFSPSKSQVTLRGEYLAAGSVKVQVADFGLGVSLELYQFTLSLHIIESQGKSDSSKIARQLEIEITESAEYLEKTLKQAQSASHNIGCKCCGGSKQDKCDRTVN